MNTTDKGTKDLDEIQKVLRAFSEYVRFVNGEPVGLVKIDLYEATEALNKLIQEARVDEVEKLLQALQPQNRNGLGTIGIVEAELKSLEGNSDE